VRAAVQAAEPRHRPDEAGAQLAPEVRAALERLGAAVAYTKRCGRGGVLRVGAGGAFATGWLVPRLGRFAAAHPEIEVRLSMAVRNPDLEEDELDIAVLARRRTGRCCRRARRCCSRSGSIPCAARPWRRCCATPPTWPG